MLIKRKSNNRSTAMANADVSSELLCTVKVCLRPVSRSTDDSLDSSSAAPFRWLFRYPLKASTHPKIDFHTETVCCETLQQPSSTKLSLSAYFMVISVGFFGFSLSGMKQNKIKNRHFFPSAFDKSIEQTFLRNSIRRSVRDEQTMSYRERDL